MMRSFFGTQEGDFALLLASIAAVRNGGEQEDGDTDSISVAKARHHQEQLESRRGFWSWLLGICNMQ